MTFIEAVKKICEKQASGKPGDIRVHCSRNPASYTRARILTVEGLRVLVNGDAPTPVDVESEDWK